MSTPTPSSPAGSSATDGRFDDGQAEDLELAHLGVVPAREDPAYLAVLRDAMLLAGLWPPITRSQGGVQLTRSRMSE